MAGFNPGRTIGGTPDLDLAEQRSWHNYLATALHMNTLLNRKLTDAHQLSLADVQLLALLHNSATDGLQMGDLAEILKSQPSRLTRQVHRLEGQGLVRRVASPYDRRRIVASITGAGRASMEQAMTTYENAVRTHFLNQLTRPQIAAMATSCRQISNGVKRTK